ncbi:MAG: leucyl/phenylalanyl-tRNA--protein transferase [Rhodospirillaceae bacterium]|nr:MAG: leucyl/phenylalanyl-tRNA--protein transferase [Rhodospirillaceae bacterium]
MDLRPELLLRTYAAGIFPMAEDRDSKNIFWVDPEQRGILPLDHFHIPKRLQRTLKNCPFRVTFNMAFETVIRACAEPTPERSDSWINNTIIGVYCALHRQHHAHSVECWQGNRLVGGLYGVALGGVFFGESMFSKEPDASKIALVRLVERLREGGFTLLDIQFVTDHLSQFGAVEISRDEFHTRLAEALKKDGCFHSETANKTS